MSHADRNDRLRAAREYASRYCDGSLSAVEIAELERWLRDDAEAMNAFVLYTEVHAQLAWNVRSHADSAAEPPQPLSQEPAAQDIPLCPPPVTYSPPSPFVGSPLFACMVATVVLALMLLGAWLYKVSVPEPPAVERSRSIATLDVPLPAIVGHVTGMHECRWNDADTETFLGAPVRIDSKYSLDAGLLEITYSTGARVILEGPCEYVIDSRASGYLGVGKLIARVEAGGGESGNRGVGESGNRENRSGDSTSPAPLFAIRTPSAVVTDLGTEFGVIVGEDGDTATHVIEGRVELRVLDDDRPEHQAIRIAAGESVHVERPAKDTKDDLAAVARGKADADLFPVHPGKLTEYVAEKRLEQFYRWQAFSDELCKRDDLVDYWDFQRDKKNPLVLRNRAPGGHDGTIEGARWVPGRLPGKQALRFSYPSHRVRVRISDKIEGSSQVTLAAWVCNEDVEKPLASLLGADDRLAPDSVCLRWQIQNSMPALLLYAEQQEGQAVGVGSFRRVVAEDRWSFMIVTHDLEKNKGAFYFNGELSNETSFSRPGHAHSKVFAPHGYMIGNSYVTNAQLLADVADPSFKGSIGELMIFNKALSSDDIGRIYEKGTATSSGKVDSAIGEQP